MKYAILRKNVANNVKAITLADIKQPFLKGIPVPVSDADLKIINEKANKDKFDIVEEKDMPKEEVKEDKKSTNKKSGIVDVKDIVYSEDEAWNLKVKEQKALLKRRGLTPADNEPDRVKQILASNPEQPEQ